MATQKEWEEIAEAVEEDRDLLLAFPTHAEIYRWAVERKFNTKDLFPAVKKELLRQLDIDYEEFREVSRRNLAARQGAVVEKLHAEAADASLVELWADANEEGAFAIVTEGEPLWYGTFWSDDFDFNNDKESALISVAKKAVWFAGQIRGAIKAPSIRLLLHMDIDPGNLNKEMLRHNVALDIDSSGAGGATAALKIPGFRSWKDNDLTALVSQ